MPHITMGVWREHLRRMREGARLEFWEHEAVASEASREFVHRSLSV